MKFCFPLVLALATQLLGQFGTDETEAQCETQFCPELVNKIDGHNQLITHIVCAAVCKEYVGNCYNVLFLE